jgi:hypothetical protein
MNLELLLLPNRHCGVHPRFHHRAWRVFLTDPARLAVSPFADLSSNAIAESDLIDLDLEDRIRFGGHAALVTRRGEVVGLLTLASIQASRLRRFLRPHEYTGTDGLYVADPGGHPKLPHLWPGQNPPPGGGGTRNDYAV